jgi:hypothetical protein
VSCAIAEYEDTCYSCGNDIEVGDAIVSTGDEGWIHQRCLNVNAKPAPLCPTCFTTLAVNGACGCDE